MKPRIPFMSRYVPWPRVTAGTAHPALAVLAAGACLVIAGCAGAGGSSGGTSAQRAAAGAAARAGGGRLPGLARAGQAIVYTASVVLRSADVSRAAALAAQVATSAGGYVASESTHLSPRSPGKSTVSLQLRIPVRAYPAALAKLTSGRLGSQVSLSRHAQDVTQAVADVGSRAASARAAIAQLRALLARAGSVSSLLAVQDQINQEEADLEALLAQQRALSAQTAYATVSVLLEGKAAVRPHREPARGFLAGLRAGWRAFTGVCVAVATGLGAAAPFLIVIAVVAGAGWGARRWLASRRAQPGASGPAG
jgi:hypothetical protein